MNSFKKIAIVIAAALTSTVLSTTASTAALKNVDEGLAWLAGNQDATTEEFKDAMKKYEDLIRPVLTKMYAGGEGSPEGNMPGMHGMPSMPEGMPKPDSHYVNPGPKVEEVD